MRRVGSLLKVPVAGAAIVLAVAACSSQGGAQDEAAGKSYTIAMVTHEAPGDTFWDKIRNGAEQAAKDHGIDLKYSQDPDAGNQATLIQNAIDSEVDGVATTLDPAQATRASFASTARPGCTVVHLTTVYWGATSNGDCG